MKIMTSIPFWRVTLALAVLTGWLVLLPAQAQKPLKLTGEEKQWLARHDGHIVLAPDPDWAPVEFIDQNGYYRGIAADILRRIEQDLGFRFKIAKLDDWNEVLERVRKGRVDVLGAAREIPERTSYLRFTRPFIEVRNALLVRQDNQEVSSLGDVQDREVATVQDHAVNTYLEKRHPSLETTEVPSAREGLRQLSFGEVDALIVDLPSASYFIQNEGLTNLKVVSLVDYSYPLAIAVRKDLPVLHSILEKGLARIDEGQQRAIVGKWVNLDYESLLEREGFWLTLVGAAAVILILLGLAALWIVSLRRAIARKTRDLQASERMLSNLISNLQGMVYRCANKPHWPMLYVSHGSRELTGYSPEDLMKGGRVNFGDLVHEQDADSVWDKVQEAVQDRQPFQLTYRIRDAEGTVKWVREQGRSVWSDQGELLFLEGLVTDITTEKQLEERLRQSQRIESIARLTGGAAHDFNNMLTPILGYVELFLSEAERGSVFEERLFKVRDAAERARSLTRQLLAFGRGQVLEMKPVDLSRVVSDITRLTDKVLREDIRLRHQLCDKACVVRVDVSQMEQILMNLVLNAQDAMPEGGEIVITVRPVELDQEVAVAHSETAPGQGVTLSIRDTGVGMDQETLNKVFDPFFTTKGEGRGTGLGLASVYGIVKQHGGAIEMSSQPGQGTEVRITLPRHGEDAEHADQVPGEESFPQGSETVLVAEDNDMVRELTQEILTDRGYEVLAASGPEECLALSRQYQEGIDLLLTDVIMPSSNGQTLFERIREQRNGIKVIFMSGYTDNVIGASGVLDDGVHFIQKPFSSQALARKVREVLDEG